MSKLKYIFPDGTMINCTKHRQLIKEFIEKLKDVNLDYYYRSKNVLYEFYTKNGYCNYDDFACFSLGWIKITKGVHPCAVFAGYTFQYNIIQSKCAGLILEEIPNIYRYPFLVFEGIDYISLLK